MKNSPALAGIADDKLDIFFGRLQAIFTEMDRNYEIAAEHYGFKCQGCDDNCCLTRFYHHTYLEYLFIRRGLTKLSATNQQAVIAKANEIYRQTALADQIGVTVRLMCPLNDEGMCMLYHHRPMICRLHGIPHELCKPGQPAVHGPGCGAFDERCSTKTYFKFDRTPFYFEMARLENEFKQVVGLSQRIKLTIAEMVM